MSGMLANAIVDMDEEQTIALTNQMLQEGVDPLVILDDCRVAMGEVGKRFEAGEYYIPELIMAGEMLKSVSAVVKPKLGQTESTAKKGKVLLGTVMGDIHDIAKDIVGFMLDVNGYDVNDLGVDVPPQKFVEAIKTYQPDVVALSGFLTLSYSSMRETVEAIQAAGLRQQVKIMVGGGTIDEQVCQYAGADAWGIDAMKAVELADGWCS